MSSKLLPTLKDENNPNLQKQIGCMNGFFQKIYCHQFLTGRRQKIPPAKEKQRTSTESSRTSCSSSSCSSSFSSLECNRIDPQTKPSPNPHPISLKDSVYRASTELSVKTEKPQNDIFRHVDSPRPLLRDAPRFSFDGRVSQDRFKSLKIKELPRLSLDSKQSTMRANPQKSSVVAKLMGIEAFPVEEKQIKAYPDEKVGTLSRSASSLSEIEFRKSGKDLRALKKILEAMHRKDDQSSELLIQEKLQRSMDMIMKPTRVVSNRRGSVEKKEPARGGDHCCADRAQSLRTMQAQKESVGCKSPRLEKKQADSSVSKKKVSSQVRESGISRTKQKPKSPNSQQRSIMVRDLRSHGNVNRAGSASHVQTEATSTKKNLECRLIASRAVAEPGGVTSEQPSPISVLNATFYRDESPSPVKKVLNIFKDDQPLWPESDHNKSENIHYLVSHMAQDESTTLLAEESSEEHRYICKILSASGIIKELDSGNGKAVIPMSLQVFLKVEQTQYSRNTSHQNPVHEIRRKLVFDVVNEIVEHKLVAEKLGRRRRRLQGEQLLRELCSQIDELEASKSSCGLDDHEDDDGLSRILRGDLMLRSTEWEDHRIEMSGIVSDIEKLIFRDLISEVVNGEAVGLRIRVRRQLFHQ